MKLILAIVNSDDSYEVQTNLSKNGYYLTKLATTGGFLKKGNTTFLIGTEDELVDKALEIINDNSKRRIVKEPITSFNDFGSFSAVQMVDVPVGGATVFILEVDKFEKF